MKFFFARRDDGCLGLFIVEALGYDLPRLRRSCFVTRCSVPKSKLGSQTKKQALKP